MTLQQLDLHWLLGALPQDPFMNREQSGGRESTMPLKAFIVAVPFETILL